MKFSVSLFCLLALSGLLQGCSGNDGNEYQGYVEGEYVYLSSARAGKLEKLLTRKGSSVESGVLLASLESEYERQAVAKSERSLAQTRALYNDMLTGKRPAEVSMAKAQLAKARADQANASAELARVEALYRQNAVSKKELDNQRAVSRSADATVVEMQKQVDVYNLPEREQRIAAQKAAVEADEAALAQARWELGQKEIRPSQAGLVYDTLYRVGEWGARRKPRHPAPAPRQREDPLLHTGKARGRPAHRGYRHRLHGRRVSRQRKGHLYRPERRVHAPCHLLQ